MKNVVLLDDLKEFDIRPEKIFDEYKQLLSIDIQESFSDHSKLVQVNCPGCGEKKSSFAFKKMMMDFHLCGTCGTLYVSPRPSSDMIRSFFEKSRSGVFLRKNFLAGTSESRSENVFSYRVQWITGLMEEYFPNANTFLDYAARYPVFLRQLNANGLFESIMAVFPECYEQENLLPENVKIIKNDEIVGDSTDIFSACEVIERIFDPLKLFKDAYYACRKNGLFIMTTTTSSGFEYQVLGEHSPNAIPIDRLNLLSLEALKAQIENTGFEIIEVSTPGRLDVEIVKNAYEKNSEIPLDPFWKYVFINRDEGARHSLQEYLQQFQLSSHVRIAAVKR